MDHICAHHDEVIICACLRHNVASETEEMEILPISTRLEVEWLDMGGFEAHNLLPEFHMGGRKSKSTEHAIHHILETIHEAWDEGKVASLLLLDVPGAYDNVSHQTLLHSQDDLIPR